ncbi:hypothetical protein LAUMK41_00960 [Mycobacterium attenuatum]|nr:hypothetical protein LAUMK41_00960 [Mycobacterium attenuatum]
MAHPEALTDTPGTARTWSTSSPKPHHPKGLTLPLNRMVDIRSNPALRQQIQAVVRRAAQQQAPAAQATASQASIAERLQELESLRASGVVNDQEYASRRAQIIAEI